MTLYSALTGAAPPRGMTCDGAYGLDLMSTQRLWRRVGLLAWHPGPNPVCARSETAQVRAGTTPEDPTLDTACRSPLGSRDSPMACRRI